MGTQPSGTACVHFWLHFVSYNHCHVADTFLFQRHAEGETFCLCIFPFSFMCVYKSGKLAPRPFPRNNFQTWPFSQAGRIQGELAPTAYFFTTWNNSVSVFIVILQYWLRKKRCSSFPLFDCVFICCCRSLMFSISPPAAYQEKTSPAGVQCHSSPLGTLDPACWSRLVINTGMVYAASSFPCLFTLRHRSSWAKLKNINKVHFCHIQTGVINLKLLCKSVFSAVF